MPVRRTGTSAGCALHVVFWLKQVNDNGVATSPDLSQLELPAAGMVRDDARRLG